jgi:hypothetical protein
MMALAISPAGRHRAGTEALAIWRGSHTVVNRCVMGLAGLLGWHIHSDLLAGLLS